MLTRIFFSFQLEQHDIQCLRNNSSFMIGFMFLYTKTFMSFWEVFCIQRDLSCRLNYGRGRATQHQRNDFEFLLKFYRFNPKNIRRYIFFCIAMKFYVELWAKKQEHHIRNGFWVWVGWCKVNVLNYHLNWTNNLLCLQQQLFASVERMYADGMRYQISEVLTNVQQSRTESGNVETTEARRKGEKRRKKWYEWDQDNKSFRFTL